MAAIHESECELVEKVFRFKGQFPSLLGSGLFAKQRDAAIHPDAPRLRARRQWSGIEEIPAKTCDQQQKRGESFHGCKFTA